MSIALDLAHLLGFSALSNQPLHFEMKQDENPVASFIRVAGASVVYGKMSDVHDERFLHGHTEPISGAMVSPQGNFVATAQGGENADVLLWDANSKTILYKFEEHEHGVDLLRFSDDERFLASVGDSVDNSLYIWDTQTGCIVTKRPVHPLPCNDLVWGGRVKDIKQRPTMDYLFATCGHNEVSLWALTPENGRLVAEKCLMNGLQRTFTCLAFSNDSEYLFAGSTSCDFTIFYVRKLAAGRTYPTCYGGVCAIGTLDGIPKYPGPNVSYETLRVFCAGADGSLTRWQWNERSEDFVESEKVQLDGPVTALSIHREQEQVLCGTSKGFIYQTDANNFTSPHLVSSNESGNLIEVFYANESTDRFTTCSRFGSVRTWNTTDFNIEHFVTGTTPGTAPEVLSMALGDDCVFLGKSNGSITAYSLHHSDDRLWEIGDAHREGVSSLVLTQNQKYIVAGSTTGDLRVWDIRFRQLVSHLKEHTMTINQLAMYNDSRHVLSCSRDRSFICWDLATEKRVSCHRQPMGGINGICLANDQQLVVSCGQEKSLSFWDLRQTSPVRQISEAHDRDILCVQPSNNGQFLITGAGDHCVKLWDIGSGQCLATASSGHCSNINSLAVSTDDKQIVSVGEDANISLWNVYYL